MENSSEHPADLISSHVYELSERAEESDSGIVSVPSQKNTYDAVLRLLQNLDGDEGLSPSDNQVFMRCENAKEVAFDERNVKLSLQKAVDEGLVLKLDGGNYKINKNSSRLRSNSSEHPADLTASHVYELIEPAEEGDGGIPSIQALKNTYDAVVNLLQNLGDHEGSSPSDIQEFLRRKFPTEVIFDERSVELSLQKAAHKGLVLKLHNGNYKINEIAVRERSRSVSPDGLEKARYRNDMVQIEKVQAEMESTRIVMEKAQDLTRGGIKTVQDLTSEMRKVQADMKTAQVLMKNAQAEMKTAQIQMQNEMMKAQTELKKTLNELPKQSIVNYGIINYRMHPSIRPNQLQKPCTMKYAVALSKQPKTLNEQQKQSTPNSEMVLSKKQSRRTCRRLHKQIQKTPRNELQKQRTVNNGMINYWIQPSIQSNQLQKSCITNYGMAPSKQPKTLNKLQKQSTPNNGMAPSNQPKTLNQFQKQSTPNSEMAPSKQQSRRTCWWRWYKQIQKTSMNELQKQSTANDGMINYWIQPSIQPNQLQKPCTTNSEMAPSNQPKAQNQLQKQSTPTTEMAPSAKSQNMLVEMV